MECSGLEPYSYAWLQIIFKFSIDNILKNHAQWNEYATKATERVYEVERAILRSTWLHAAGCTVWSYWNYVLQLQKGFAFVALRLLFIEVD